MRTSIVNRRRRRRIKRGFDLQLTAMLDMLIIILVFLLKSYSASTVQLATSNEINLPSSNAEEVPGDALNVIIDPSGITVDSERVVLFKLDPNLPAAPTVETATYEIEDDQLADSGRRILPLFDSLMKAKEKEELTMNKTVWKDQQGNTVEPPKFHGTVVIQADKAVRYDLLRKIMYTAGAAQYKTFKLITLRKDQG